MTLSVVRLSPLGSQLSFSHSLARIESITDWEAIARKYRALMGELDDHGGRSETAAGEPSTPGAPTTPGQAAGANAAGSPS